MVVNKDAHADENSQCNIKLQLRTNLHLMPPVSSISESVKKQSNEQHQRLQELLSRALQLGESNSAIIIGPRGVGKSALIRVALSQYTSTPDVGGSLLSSTHSASVEGILIRLNGLIQTDDRQALREITRQLCLEDKLAMKQFGSFAENLTFLLSSLKEGNRNTSKCVVFILEEFDLFCHHKNQTLLYNLFDVAQSAQNPVCVLGVTCRLDVIELLEKRVKSRFSHRQIHLLPPDIEHYTSIAKQFLTLQKNKSLKQSVVQAWNDQLDKLFNQDGDVEDGLSLLYCVTKDIATLKQALHVAVASLPQNCIRLPASSLCYAIKQTLSDSTPLVLRSLSILQIALLIAMMHLTRINNEDIFNFEMVHFEYLKYTRRYSSVNSFTKAVVLKAFDHLCCLELVTPHDGMSARSGIQKEYQMMRLQLPPLLLRDTLAKIPNMPTDLVQWASFSA